jgi:hypothetical protein
MPKDRRKIETCHLAKTVEQLDMAKIPFEKIRSLIDRRKLFEALLREQTEILCKGDDESLFHLKPISIVSDSLIHGWMEPIEELPKLDTEVLGNFSVGTERFFFHAPLKVMEEEATFHVNCDVYRLQRRSSLRLAVASEYECYVAITESHGKPVYSIAQVADLSAGGARLFFSDIDSPIQAGNSKAIHLKVGDQFKAVLHLGRKKNLDVQCQVKHIQQGVHRGAVMDYYGVEFVELTTHSKNRLLSLTMDLQRRMTIDDYAE